MHGRLEGQSLLTRDGPKRVSWLQLARQQWLLMKRKKKVRKTLQKPLQTGQLQRQRREEKHPKQGRVGMLEKEPGIANTESLMPWSRGSQRCKIQLMQAMRVLR